MEITTVALDLAKRVFQVHGVDAAGDIVVRRALRRAYVLPFFAQLSPCLINRGVRLVAWAHELTGLGHTVKLMPPAFVKAYVKRGKTDAADAEAICEAVTMRLSSYYEQS
jgi:transposase